MFSLVPKKVPSIFPCFTEKGIKLVQEGQYAQAVSMFTEAIKCDPKDNRYVICQCLLQRRYTLKAGNMFLICFVNYIV